MAALIAFSLPVFAITEVNDDNIEAEVINSKTPVVVMFYATWCGYCKDLEKEIVKREGSLKGKVKFVRVDVDKTSAGSIIRALPTTVLVKNGKSVGGFQGADLLKLELLINDATK